MNDLTGRYASISQSDAPNILGLNRNKTPLITWLEKTGKIKKPDKKSKALPNLKPSLRKWFSVETNKQVKESNGKLTHPRHDYLECSIDGFIEDENAALLIKTVKNDYLWGDSYTDIMPEYYLIQAAYCCDIANVDAVYLAVLFHNLDFRIYKYEKNDNLQLRVKEELIRFWQESIVKGVEPEPISFKDIDYLYPSIADKHANATPEIEEAITKYRELSNEIKWLEEIKEKEKDVITCFMKDAEILESATGDKLVSYKACRTSFFDTITFKEEHPQLYLQYKKNTTTRRFLARGKGGKNDKQ